MAYYFFSDVHLGIDDILTSSEREKILIKFLDEIKHDADGIIINGDLFDYWIEYKTVVPRGHYRLLAKLADLSEEGVKFTYISGNHDFWKGDYFTKEFGIEILDTHVDKVIDGKKFFIHHGDGLAFKDTGYKIAKKVLRNSFSQFLYSKLHPDLGIKLARGTSSKSRNHTSKKDYSEQDGLREYAKEKIHEGFDYVIMGHRHLPWVQNYGNGCYINLGDWMRNFTYGKFEDGRFELIRFYDINTKSWVKKLIQPAGTENKKTVHQQFG